MSNIRKIPTTDESTVDQAAAWIAKLDRGLSSEDEQALRAWLSSSRANHREFLESAKLWDRMDGLSRLADIFPEPAVPVAESKRVAPRGAWKAAASVLIAIAAATTWLGWDRADSTRPVVSADVVLVAAPNEYETAIGEQSVFELSDGTRLVLNTNSAVVVNFSEKNRLLTLKRGEIHVTVAYDPSRPLSVVVGDNVVQAVGTEFNLEITSNHSVELVVTEGVVMIGVLDAPIDELPLDEPVLLQPSSTLVASGQEVQIGSEAVPADPIETNDIEAEEIAVRLSWRNGNLIFRGESLEEAVSEVGRYTAVEFVFLDEDSKKVRLAGMFRAGDVDGLLIALRKNFNISYEWVGEDKILLSAAQ